MNWQWSVSSECSFRNTTRVTITSALLPPSHLVYVPRSIPAFHNNHFNRHRHCIIWLDHLLYLYLHESYTSLFEFVMSFEEASIHLSLDPSDLEEPLASNLQAKITSERLF